MNIFSNKKKFSFKCQGSSNCCVSRGNYGFVYLSNVDLNRLSKFFKIKKNEFIKRYCDLTNNFLHLKEVRKNGDCIFLHNKKCSIYTARPIQCRTWPFWNDNMNAKKWNSEIAKFCPGIGKGKEIKKNEIKKKLDLDKKNEKEIVEFKILQK